MNIDKHTDKRIQKTLHLLRDAFFDLVLTYSYDEIKVSDIIKKANIGRSTFYQHFKSKDELLAASLYYPLSVIAKCGEDDSDFEDLVALMAHFWSNRKFAPRIFSGTARRLVITELASKNEQRLTAISKHSVDRYVIPVNIVAHQLAEAQMTPIIDWLTGKGRCSEDDMAKHIQRSTVALKSL
jgi:AcrR family transcriptional regulator